MPNATRKRYACLWTPDTKKKTKVWHDGFLVLHHHNSKIILYDHLFRALDESFFRIPPLADHSRYSLASGSLRNFPHELPHSLVLPEDEQIDFDSHLATVQSLVFSEQVDLTPILDHARGRKRKIDDSVRSASPDLPKKNASQNIPPVSYHHAHAPASESKLHLKDIIKQTNASMKRMRHGLNIPLYSSDNSNPLSVDNAMTSSRLTTPVTSKASNTPSLSRSLSRKASHVTSKSMTSASYPAIFKDNLQSVSSASSESPSSIYRVGSTSSVKVLSAVRGDSSRWDDNSRSSSQKTIYPSSFM